MIVARLFRCLYLLSADTPNKSWQSDGDHWRVTCKEQPCVTEKKKIDGKRASELGSWVNKLEMKTMKFIE